MQVVSAQGETRTLLLVLERGDDVLACIREALAREGARTGLVTAGIGSFSVLHMHTITRGEGESAGDIHMDAKGPIEVGSMLGSIQNGEPHIHFVAHHTADDRTYIGHLEPGSIVAWRAEIGLILFDATTPQR
jgi:predicted DNA-binding protein with PD1-like motif